MNWLNFLAIALLLIACGVLDLMNGAYRPFGFSVMLASAALSASAWLWVGAHLA